jgi:signal transduction histidine kinase
MIEVNPADALILNVDDYVPGRYARTRLLQQAGYRVIEAGTGKETFEVMDEHKPALILLDVNLPDISGFEVCRQLRSNPQTESITILHISASSVLTQHQVNGLDSGADGYLVEPVEPAVLLATINAYLRARRAEDEMRKSNEELRWFAYRVGHDLNEPLRTISAHTQMLKLRLGEDQLPAASASLDFIVEGAAKMRLFIEGLLHYAQATSCGGKVGLIECESLLERVIENLDSSIRDSGASITHDQLPAVAATEQLEYVFQNLISNAIKYRKQGIPPKIHIAARADGNAWVFSVQDNGIGIDPQYRERIFGMFHRLHGNDIPGNGIGLALVRKIMAAHGGRIWVESVEGAGSTFYLSLPN